MKRPCPNVQRLSQNTKRLFQALNKNCQCFSYVMQEPDEVYWWDYLAFGPGWVHVVIIFHGTTSNTTVPVFSVYENKVKKTLRYQYNKFTPSLISPIHQDSTGQFVFGRKYITTATSSEYGSVGVDEVLFWQKQLNESQINTLYDFY